MRRKASNLGLLSTIGVLVLSTAGCSSPHSSRNYQFSAEQKGATSYTRDSNQAVYKELDFDSKVAFDDSRKGLIAPLINDGNIDGGVFNATAMNFMQDKKAPDTVNPSLWRHAQLANYGGLFKVTDHIYQVRGQDLSNLTIIETKNGVVFYDVEYAADTLAKSIELYQQHRGKRPLKGVIISHSHADHFGGFDGIIKAGLATEEELKGGKIPVIVPKGFLEEAVAENVTAGNIMARRAGYQYGNVLKPGPTGIITGALGPALANGASALPIPNREITKDGEKVTIDGVNFVFYLAPHSEAPAEMVMYIPEWKALSMAEDVNHLQHNIYTLRGAQTRDASVWAKYIGDAVARWGSDVQVHFGPHTWPVWGNKNVLEYMKNQRDVYQSLYDTTLRYANYGYRPDDIAENAKLPKSVFNQWDNRPYYGNTRNNLKSTYVRNLGWYSGNPAELAKYPDAERGKRYVETMGGESKVLDAAVASFKKGDYRFTADLLNNIVAYTADNKNANLLMADALEQLGYQEENSLYRNWYLAGAVELRTGGSVKNDLSTSSPEVIAGLPPELFISYLGMMVDQTKAEQAGNAVINLKLDDGSKFGLDLHNGVLNRVSNFQAANADATLDISKRDLLEFASGKSTMDTLESSGKAKISGDRNAVAKLNGIFALDLRNDMNLILPLQKENRIQ
ncbi:MBL fold metallo-hydrolase [Achromobacter pestifer]|uniref:MBL fold metallo-hydrolase n=1 Tax=Achromobacter pestifer TaxID=1353889 RepID=A0A7D4DY50_9BURK|nr:alkyl sulfatase dimerization domain-containing protein [Achromobacter pestifer]QKH35347.1 MBL fold metallo-hydrolase [Achromobacter pestifer]